MGGRRGSLRELGGAIGVGSSRNSGERSAWVGLGFSRRWWLWRLKARRALQESVSNLRWVDDRPSYGPQSGIDEQIDLLLYLSITFFGMKRFQIRQFARRDLQAVRAGHILIGLLVDELSGDVFLAQSGTRSMEVRKEIL